MTQRQTHMTIAAASALFAGLCVAYLHPALVALMLACAVSVIGIAVERERRRAHGH